MVAIFVVLTILALVGVDLALHGRRRSLALQPAASTASPVLPKGLFVSPGHAWVELQRSGLVRVGLDDFVRHALGGADQLVLKSTGEQIKKGEPLLTVVRDGHQLVLKAPVSGTIRASNADLAARPGRLTASAYGENWAYSIQPSRLGDEIAGLQVAERAAQWLNAELDRLADWFACLAPARPGLAMQDGGLPVSGALTQVDDAGWQGFQAHFLDC